MTLSPTGVIPEELMFPARLAEVIRFLENLAVAGQIKEQLLVGWSRTVGVKVSSGQLAKVRRSGVDQ